MRFEGQPYQPKEDTPNWFYSFLGHYKFVIKYLVESTSKKLLMGQDVQTYNEQVTVQDSIETTINHGLQTNTKNIVVNGRTEGVIVRGSSAGSIRIVVRLLSFRLTNTTGYTNRIELEDARLLKVSDVLRFGTQTRTITNVNGNIVYLDSSVYCDNVTAISLATDTVTVSIF